MHARTYAHRPARPPPFARPCLLTRLPPPARPPGPPARPLARPPAHTRPACPPARTHACTRARAKNTYMLHAYTHAYICQAGVFVCLRPVCIRLSVHVHRERRPSRSHLGASIPAYLSGDLYTCHGSAAPRHMHVPGVGLAVCTAVSGICECLGSCIHRADHSPWLHIGLQRMGQGLRGKVTLRSGLSCALDTPSAECHPIQQIMWQIRLLHGVGFHVQAPEPLTFSNLFFVLRLPYTRTSLMPM